MISFKTTPCRGFVLCIGSALPGDIHVQKNDGDGVAMQYAYVYRGNATVTDGETTDEIPGRQLVDLTKYMGKEVSFTMLGDPTLWVAINPVPATDRFSAEFVPGGKTITVKGGAQRKTILCLDGAVQCNDVLVEASKYVSLRSDIKVSLTVPEGSAAVVLTTL